ncbi:MAG: site-specific integrase [Gallionella sp.]|nr:site-specific integrase [Gallionella sp.]MDP1941881.1 site-specific integrase [Gallionella sp.]
MSITLATHLKTSRHGIYYFRYTIPAPLRPYFGKKEVMYSLHTRDPAKARKLAYTLTSQTNALFEKMAYDPTRFNPFDPSSFPTADSVRPYEIDIQRGIFKTDGAEDHARALEALAVIKTMQIMQAPQPAPIQQQYAEPQPEHTILITEALTAYLLTLNNKKTRFNYASFINRFIVFHGNSEVHKIRGVDVVNWKADLLKSVKPVSVDIRLQALQSLLTWCLKHNYLSDQKPLATKGKFTMTKTERETQNRGAERFKVEELNKIFDPIAYASYYTLNTKKKSNPRFWFPLIALFTGMRLEEIAQLQKEDIKTIQGIEVFDINRNGGKSVKTQAGIRAIPIHPTLLKMGFLDYVRSVETPALWPELKRNANGYGNPISKAFIRHLEEIGVRKDSDRGKVFHSLRDTFNNACELISAITPEIRYTLMGHEQSGANEKNYLAPKTIQRLKHDGIDLLIYQETIGGATHTLKL